MDYFEITINISETVEKDLIVLQILLYDDNEDYWQLPWNRRRVAAGQGHNVMGTKRKLFVRESAVIGFNNSVQYSHGQTT